MLIRLVLTEIQRFKNVKINKEMYGIRTATQRPDGHTFLCKFFGIFKWLYLAYFWVYLHQTWEESLVCSFWLCGSIVANPIIYTLIPSPSRFENRQWRAKHPACYAAKRFTIPICLCDRQLQAHGFALGRVCVVERRTFAPFKTGIFWCLLLCSQPEIKRYDSLQSDVK